MKRKLLAITLALSLGCGLAIPAAAAQTAEERLAAVTARVKATLDLDTGAYASFYGDLDEDLLAPSWRLEWSGADGGRLSVTAAEDGKILRYYVSENREELAGGISLPAFPAGSRDGARQAALAFLDKVLAEDESAVMEDQGADRLDAETYRFRGEILIHGLPAGMSFSVSVNCADNRIMSFYRDDLAGQVMGGVPDKTPKVLSDKAGETLKGTLKLRLEYVPDEDDGQKAVLRYLPEYGDDYYVDAATGTLVNLSELREDVEKEIAGGGFGFTANSAAEDSGEGASTPAASPTPAETAGAEKLKGVLDKDALDRRARAVSELGLSAYTLSTVGYAAPREEDEDQTVTASLRYGRQVNGVSWRRTVVLDARTGDLLRVWSSGWLPEEAVARPVDASAAQAKAEAFLKAQCGEEYSGTALYDSSDALESDRGVFHSFNYVRKANGYFFPANSISVGVDSTDGSISSYEKVYDDAVVFDSPDGIMTMEQAVDGWLGTYTVDLQYVWEPAAVDYSQPEYAPLEDMGVGYLYRLALGYRLEREDAFSGIDAKTGRPVEYAWSDGGGLAYDDLAGCWARTEIEALAQYQVGYAGGKFIPDKTLTQIDLVALLASTHGYVCDLSEAGAADGLYDYAWSMGLLGRGERMDGAVLTRMDAIRMILDAMGCGELARLRDIYRVKFTDAGSIPAADLGYAALAQGLGMTAGDSGGRLQPNTAATRAQAAVMLYNLMAR